jgi:glycosyltransferase involved in cell wall biosynthesis
MNILFLCEGDAESWRSWSGISKSLVDHLRAAGHNVTVGDVDLHGADRWLAAVATVSRSRRRWGTRYHLGGVPFRLRSRRANRHLRASRTRIDLVLQIGSTFRLRRNTPVPYFVCSDSNIRMAQYGASSGYSDAAPLSRSDVAAISRREHDVYHGAAALFPLSERLRRSFIDDFGIPADRVRAIYAGPNLDPSRMAGVDAARAEPRPPTVLFVGLQFHRKGGDVLVDSFKRLRERLPTARLLLAGVPIGTVDQPGVTCLGELDKNVPAGATALARAYACSDVFALPTRFEPFGIAFVEAMHFGLPCVGPSAWAVPEIIADGETGYTVPVDDVEALTDRLWRLLSDAALARAMGHAARQRARRLFTWPHVIDRMTEVMTAFARHDAGSPAALRSQVECCGYR